MERACGDSLANSTPAGAAHVSIAAFLGVSPLPVVSESPANRRSTPHANEDLRPHCSAQSAPSGCAASYGSVAADLGLAADLGVTPLPVHRGSTSPQSRGAIEQFLGVTPLSVHRADVSGASERCSLQELQERIRSPALCLTHARSFCSQLDAEAEIVAAGMLVG